MLTANPGEPARPLRKVASGGELSRTMLALKTVLAAHDPVRTLVVFDEIDANVGGRLGDVLGQKLAALGRSHQVMCVTHLPQVASYAAHQWTIRKAIDREAHRDDDHAADDRRGPRGGTGADAARRIAQRDDAQGGRGDAEDGRTAARGVTEEQKRFTADDADDADRTKTRVEEVLTHFTLSSSLRSSAQSAVKSSSASVPAARYARTSVASPLSSRRRNPPCATVTATPAPAANPLPTKRGASSCKPGVAAAGAVAFGTARPSTAKPEDKKPGEGIPTRPLGKTGVNVSILCLGGWHIGAVKDKDEAVKIMHAAIDEGVTFFDNCWDYHDGGSEEIMGKALAADGGKWRKKCFLMTKNCARDAKGVRAAARRQPQAAEDRRHRPDADPRDQLGQRPGVGGRTGRACRRCSQAQKAGKVRFVGLHRATSTPHIHLKMLPVHKWDTVQCPINVCDHFYRSFAKELIPAAKKQNTGVIGMKSLGGGRREDREGGRRDRGGVHPVRAVAGHRVGGQRDRSRWTC